MDLKIILQWLSENNYTFEFVGDDCINVNGFSSLNNYKNGDITWIKNKDYYDAIENKPNILIAVVQQGLEIDIANKIVTPNSKEVFFSILKKFWSTKHKCGFIGSNSYISKGVKIDSTAYIGYNCSIIGNVSIGANTIIENNVSIINDVVIGDDCIIHSGTVIGTDGYGYAFGADGLPVKVEHFGGVVIGNRVEIGANSCVDRGTIDCTFIQDDVKIDNLVHIAHNSILQKGSAIVAGAIICGSVNLGEKSYVAPGVIVKNQIAIGEGAFVGMGAVVTKPVDDYSVVVGVPAKKIRNILQGDK